MGFISNRDLNKKPMAQPCTKDEWEAKLRELKITNLLGEDIEELKEWIYSHYVPTEKENPFLKFSGVHINNPMKTVIINEI